MSNIFVEVDEAMKQERIEKLWQRYGGFFIGFLAIIIIGTAANAGYSSWKLAKHAKQTDLLLSANDKAYISKDLQGGLRDINELNIAASLIEQNKQAQALEHYNEVAKNSNNDNAIKQLASYMAINISRDLSAEEKIAKLEVILSNKDNPWRYHGALDAALIEANINHNYSKARSYISIILNNSDIPKTLQQKAQSLDILYSLMEKTQGNHDVK